MTLNAAKKIFRKTIKQIEATKRMAGSATHFMSFGGSRSGKTFITIRNIIVRACKETSRHIILRRTFNSCKTAIWLDTLPKVLRLCFPTLLVHWNKTDYYIRLPNGSEIWIGGMGNDQEIEKILGKEYSTIYYNETSELTWKAVQIVLTRLAEKTGLKNRAFYDMNPPTKRHWSYWVFIKKLNPETSDPMPEGQYDSILMNPTDNLENVSATYMDILNGLDDKQKARFMHGEFTEGDDGNAYYSFSREVNVRPIDKSYHVGSTHIGMDFNVMPMTGVICYYVNRTFYITDEAFLENSDTFKMTYHLGVKGHKGGKVYPDSTGKNRKTSGKSDHQILRDAGFSVVDTRNPFVTDRVNNVNRLLRDGRIIIDPKCKKLINDLEKVVWKNDELDQKTDPLLTHISDALGYLCHHLDPLIGLPEKSKTINL